MSDLMGWLTAWLLMFLLLYVLSRTRPGHTLIYYWAWLLVFLLIVTQGTHIAALISKGDITGQQNVVKGSPVS